MAHFVNEAFPNGTVAAGTLRTALAGGIAWTPADGATVNSTDLTGLTVREIIINAQHFVYDASDTTSAHDPDGGVLVSSDGKRFIAEIAPASFVNVLARQNDPPETPSVGDRYIVGPAPTGDWADNGDDFAYYTAGGWLFVSPVIGQRTYVRGAAEDYQYGESGDWASALLASGTVRPAALRWPFGPAVAGMQTSPPGGTPSDGTLYIVQSSGSGAWSGQSNNIAEYVSATASWIFHTPYEGALLYNQNTNQLTRWSGSSWGSP